MKLDKGKTSVFLTRDNSIGKATVSDTKRNLHAIMNFAPKMHTSDEIKGRKVMKVAMNQDLDKAMIT